MRKIILFLGILCFLSTPSLAQEVGGAGEWLLSLGVHQPQSKVQSPAGNQDILPLSYGLAVGYTFDFYWGHKFAPQLGYLHHQINSEDSYGKYSMSTIYILYDLLYQVSPKFALTYGFGNFMKKVDGGGGTVTVPNGAGSTTAYKAESATSFSGTLDFGMKWDFGEVSKTWAMGLNIFAFELLEPKKMQLAYQVNAIFYL